MGAHLYDDKDLTLQHIAGWKISFTDDKKRDAHLYECEDVTDFKSHFRAKDCLHTSHENGRSAVWMCIWLINSIWKISYVYYMRKYIHWYEFCDAPSWSAAT
jgi:hypothetical protein